MVWSGLAGSRGASKRLPPPESAAVENMKTARALGPLPTLLARLILPDAVARCEVLLAVIGPTLARCAQ